MGTLSQLLRWNTSLMLKNVDGTDLKTVWLRVIGDHDLQEAYKLARIASAAKRGRLKDIDSIDFKDEILSFADASEEECKALINAARDNAWTSQALSTVVRGDEVKLESVAIDPDAPTLEEQERVDRENLEVDTKYQKDIEEFVAQKRVESKAELDTLDIDQLRLLAQAEATVLLPLTVFMNELIDQKTWRAVYVDKDFKERGFDSVEDFRDMLEPLRQQLIEAYAKLEAGLDDLKN